MKRLAILGAVVVLGVSACGSDLPTSFENGTHLVGTDIETGTYRTDGQLADGDEPCTIYLSKKAADADTITDARTTTEGTNFTLTSGLYVTSEGCKEWTRVD